jgi:RNA polymerase sigma factor (sigma-70 family)
MSRSTLLPRLPPAATPACEALVALLEDLRPALARLYRSFDIAPDEGQDILQDALVVFLQKRDRILEPHAWILGTARHLCRHARRRERRKLYQAVDAAILELAASPERDGAERRALLSTVGREIDCMGGRCREILYLRYRLGCDRFETAARVRCSASSVGTLERRCLAALVGRLIGGARRCR